MFLQKELLRSITVLLLSFTLSFILAPVLNAEPPSKVEDGVSIAAETHGFANVVIEITPEEPMPFSRPKPVSTEAGRIRGRKVVADMERLGAKEVYDSGLGLILARLTPGALNRIERLTDVKKVRIRKGREGSMAGALDAVGIQSAGALIEGFSSGAAGEEIVIIDGGFDLQHPAFAGANINQYCSCGTITSGCSPGGSNWLVGAGSAKCH